MSWSTSRKGRHIALWSHIEKRTIEFSCNNDFVDTNVQMEYIIPQTVDLYYFELNILKRNDSSIDFGLVPSNADTNDGVGWIDDSIGYLSYDGSIRHSSNVTANTIGSFDAGDLVGCLLRQIQCGERVIKFCQFTKNGRLIGRTVLLKSNVELRPAVGFHGNLGDSALVNTNFGENKFRFSVEGKIS